MLNKDYLFTINYAATQELDRILDWHMKGIDRSVSGNAEDIYGESFLRRFEFLDSKVDSLESRITSLEPHHPILESKVISLNLEKSNIETRLSNIESQLDTLGI
jgi:predicted nuclease with TOPRIM domain